MKHSEGCLTLGDFVCYHSVAGGTVVRVSGSCLRHLKTLAFALKGEGIWR